MADNTRLVIELETVLRNLNRTLRGLDQVRNRLNAIASIRFSRQASAVGLERQVLAAQRLNLQQQRLSLTQQRLSVQTQELINRQERARQTADRLALSQQRLGQAQQRAATASSRQADSHVRFFKSVQRAALDADKHVRFFRATEASLAKAPPVDAHVRAYRALQRGIADADRHVQFFRANEAALRRAPQLDAHVRAFRGIETSTRRANAELERARRAAERLARTQDTLRQFQQRMNSLGAAALRVGGGLRSVGASAAILVTGPLVALGTIAARSAADLDAIRNRLIATEGSLTAANERLAQLRRLADQSIGVTRRAAVDTFAILATLGEVTEDTINKQIRSFGRLNAAFTIDDQQLFFRNLLQIFQQGFEIKDIKEALGRVPIFNLLLQEAFGTADPKKLRELKAAGKLTLDSFLAGLATAIETDPVLGKIGESISVRFAKTFERLRDALEPLGLAILGPLERIITAVEPIILRLSAAFNSLSPGIQTAIVVVGLLTAALGPILFILGGIASGIGALATAAAALLPIIASIGLPAIAALLGGLAIIIAEITAVIAAFGLAWRANFLNIRGLVADVASAVDNAFTWIRIVFTEATARILPTLQSITTKVLGAISAAWERYGKVVVKVVDDVFEFVVDVTKTFLSVFTNFVDLVLKLIDGDWRGAWRAFSRLVIDSVDSVVRILFRLHRIVSRALNLLLVFIINQAVRFSQAGQRLATVFITALASDLVLGAPRIKDALFLMLVSAAAGVAVGPIAQLLIARLIAEMRKAAAEGIPFPEVGPQVGADIPVGIFGAGRRRRGLITTTETDDKAARQLADQANRLREAEDKLREQEERNRIERIRSQVEQEFALTKDGLDRQQRALEDSFEDRLTTIRNYFSERARLEEAGIDAELARERALRDAIVEEFTARRRQAKVEFDTARADIERDKRLKGDAKILALHTAEVERQTKVTEALGDFEQDNAEVSTRILTLQKQRADVGVELVRLERILTEEIAKQRDQLRFDLLEQQGRTADAEAGRLKARFTEVLRDLRIDTSTLGGDLQDALNRVDLSILQQRLEDLPEPVRVLVELLDISLKRAQIAEAQQLVDDLSAGLRLDEQRIQNRVLDGLLNQRDAQAAILALQQQYRGVLLDVLRGELAKAEAIKDQGLIVSIREQIAEVERLGIAIDEAGQRINQALFSDLQSGLSGIFSGARKGFEGLRDAAISFGERLLDTLNDIAATSILQQIEELFKPDATNTEGTIGGFLSKLFGLQPKQAADAATAAATLQTGATTAAVTITGSATVFATAVTTAATTFVTLITAAASAIATALGAASAVGGLGGGLGAAFGAATGLFPAVPGGVYKVVEGGYSEAVLTTDPKHYARQLAILKAYINETRGLGGRIKGFAQGAFISPAQSTAMMLSGMNMPPITLTPNLGDIQVGSAESIFRLRQVLVDERTASDWINTPDGERAVIDVLRKNQPIVRRLSGRE